MNKSLHSFTMMTHDLKSPLNAIMVGLEYMEALLSADEIDKQEITDFIKMLRTAGNDMQGLIQSALTAARIEAGKERAELQTVAGLSAILNEIIHTFHYQAAVNHIQLLADIPSYLPVVNWDIKKIHYHVLNNLVSNALKFVPANGTVIISARAMNNVVTLSVADDGPGIPPEERGRIFDKFETSSGKSLRAFEGSGLGLYTANLFIRQHGGRIDVYDGLNGKGICFTITLPTHPTVPVTHLTSSTRWTDQALRPLNFRSGSRSILPPPELSSNYVF